MAIRPWMTSDDLIASVKRKIALPINQRTFSEEDILAFANEEIMISQVPDIMMYHEEYFVYSEDVLLVANQERYPIPERAIGQKLRDVFYKDLSGNLFEMTRVNPDDKSYFQSSVGNINQSGRYYLEGNDLVLTPLNVASPTGWLRFSYFLRPNQLVPNAEAAISESFFKNITLVNASLVAGDTVNIGELTFTAVAGGAAALEFDIGATSALSAANLDAAINTDNTYTATVSSAIIEVDYSQLSLEFLSSSAGIVVSSQVGIRFNSDLPVDIADGSIVDFLQTKPGHKLLDMDVQLGANSVSTNAILFDDGVIPENFIIGDYISLQYECIIPQIPPDLHNGLAERVCARILAAQGDMMGFQLSSAKIGDIKKAEGVLTENRVDGAPVKITQRKGMLSYQRMGSRRRF